MVRLVWISFLVLVFALPAFGQTWPTRPDRDRTPGEVVDGITITKICTTKWGSDVRHVTAAMKQQVRDAYQFRDRACPLTALKTKRVRRAEIDHLIPRSLGGADTVKNLWPQCYEQVNRDKSKQLDGAYKKDQLEKALHNRVCNPRSADLLREYQRRMARDWKGLYEEIFGAGLGAKNQ